MQRVAERLEQRAGDRVGLRVVFGVPLDAEREALRAGDADGFDRIVLGDPLDDDALAGLAANAAGLSAGLTRTDVAAAAFWVPMSFVLAALAAVAMGVRLVRLRRRLS